MEKEKVIALRVPKEIDEALQRAAKAEYSSVSAIIRRTLAQTLLSKGTRTHETIVVN